MRALILSGGAAKGAFEVGVLQYILGDLKRHYDIYCGISVGGINSGFLAQYNSGDEYNAVRELTNVWLDIESKNIYKSWKPFGQLSAIFKPSFYDGAPLHDLINKSLNTDLLLKSDKLAYIGCTSITTGEYRVFNSKEENFKKAVVAGASFPVMLNPVEIDGHYWADGGLQTITPIKQGIDCGCTELDIVVTTPIIRNVKTIKKPSILDALRRIINLATDRVMDCDIEQLLMHNKLVSSGIQTDKKLIKVNIIRPSDELVSNQMVFKKDEIKKLIERGYYGAKEQFKLQG